MNEKKNQKRKVMILVLVLGLVLLTIGGTYAFFTYTRQGQKENTLTTGIMYFVYDELPGQEGNQIAITNAFPMTDDLGKVQENEGVFEFQVRAKTQGADINYEIYLTKNDSSTLPNKVVKTYLSTIEEKGGTVESETPINNRWTKQDVNLYSKIWNSSLPILNGAKAKTLEQAIVPDSPNEYEKTYRYRMWLDEDANGVDSNGKWIYSNKSFSVNVNVYASNEELPPPTPPVEEATLVSGSSWFSTSDSGIQKSQVTRVEFVQSKVGPEGTTKSWNVSYSINQAIMAYLTQNNDGEDTYTVTIGSDAETIYMSASSNNMFRDFSGLKEIKGLELLDTSKVTSMDNMFSNCSQLSSVGDISNWDTSSVTDMSYMFSNCSQLSSLYLSSWDLLRVTNMSHMFQKCIQLNDFSFLEQWDTSSVTDMSYMFSDCSQLNSLDLSGWDISSVTNMASMFLKCSQLSSVGDISNWDTSSIENMSSMFWGCSQLRNVGDLSSWDTSSVTDMGGMFRACGQLSTTITIRGNVTSYYAMLQLAATADDASITVNYIDDDTRTIAEAMVATNNGAGHVSLGEQVA